MFPMWVVPSTLEDRLYIRVRTTAGPESVLRGVPRRTEFRLVSICFMTK